MFIDQGNGTSVRHITTVFVFTDPEKDSKIRSRKRLENKLGNHLVREEYCYNMTELMLAIFRTMNHLFQGIELVVELLRADKTWERRGFI